MVKNKLITKIIIFAFLLILFFVFWIFFMKQESDLPETITYGDEIDLNQDDLFTIQSGMAAVSGLKEIDENDHFIGDLEAPVQIIIFEDFNCGFCADLAEEIKKVQEYFSDQVVIAYRHSPLSARIPSYWAALASECAAEQEKFWEMYEKLFENYKFGTMDFEQFKKDADALELNSIQFSRCLETEKYRQKIEESVDEAESAGAYGSPTIFINGEVLPGAYPFDDFKNQQGEHQEGLQSVINRKINEANQ